MGAYSDSRSEALAEMARRGPFQRGFAPKPDALFFVVFFCNVCRRLVRMTRGCTVLLRAPRSAPQLFELRGPDRPIRIFVVFQSARRHWSFASSPGDDGIRRCSVDWWWSRFQFGAPAMRSRRPHASEGNLRAAT